MTLARSVNYLCSSCKNTIGYWVAFNHSNFFVQIINLDIHKNLFHALVPVVVVELMNFELISPRINSFPNATTKYTTRVRAYIVNFNHRHNRFLNDGIYDALLITGEWSEMRHGLCRASLNYSVMSVPPARRLWTRMQITRTSPCQHKVSTIPCWNVLCYSYNHYCCML